ncbi:MAG: MXAN_6640 family putative metalloprotease, partial [Marmoricola sp.]
LRFAACLLALAVGAALTLDTAAASSPNTSDPAALAVLRQAQRMATPTIGLAPLARPTAGAVAPSVVHPTDGTATMVALAKALPRLNASDRAAALTLLGTTASAPCNGTDGQPDASPYETATDPEGHFEIHYTSQGPNAVTDPTYVSRVAASLDTVYDTEIGAMGYQPPLIPTLAASNNTGSGDPVNWWSGGTQIPIALCNIAADLYGYCAPIGVSTTWAFPAACTLRNSYANKTVNNVTYAYYNSKYDGSDTDAPLKVTAAHEFFHAVQFRQNANEPLWLMEGSAVWMENEVYPQIHDYVQYLPYTGIKKPLVPFTTNSGYWPYGDFTVFKTLAGSFRTPDVVREIWTYLGQHQASSALSALIAVAKARGRSLPSVLVTYGIWNTLAPHGYPSANLYRPAVWWLNPRLDRANRVLASHSVNIRPLADTAVAISRGSHVLPTTKLRISISGPSGTAGGWFTIRRQFANGTTVTAQARIGGGGSTTITIPFNASVSYVAITLNNVNTSGSARSFGIRATVL